MHTMRIKRPYYDAIMAGQKTLEVRVGYDNIKRYQAGELIRLETSEAWETVKIKAVRTYASFEDMLAAEGWQKIAPDAGDTATESKQGVKGSSSLPPTHNATNRLEAYLRIRVGQSGKQGNERDGRCLQVFSSLLCPKSLLLLYST